MNARLSDTRRRSDTPARRHPRAAAGWCAPWLPALSGGTAASRPASGELPTVPGRPSVARAGRMGTFRRAPRCGRVDVVRGRH